MATLTINAKNFLLGESSSDYASDRGFSPDSYGLNLTKERGVLAFIESGNERGGGGTTLTGNIIASANDANFSGNDKYFLDDEGAFYTYSGTTLTKRQTGGGTFTLGTSDLIQFKLTTFATSTDAIYELTGSDLSSIQNWWSGLNSNVRHPMEIVEDELFIADQNVVYFWNGTSSGTAFTLPTQSRITSLRKHPDGRTLLAFTNKTDDFSHTQHQNAYVYYCDPNLRDWTREVAIEAQVEGTHVNGGVVYVTYGKNFGYFDGNGLIPLKRLKTSGTTYSHNIASFEDTVVFRDGLNAIAYGDLGAGNVFWNIFRNTADSNNLNCISYLGDNKMLFAHAGSGSTGRLYEIDYDNIGQNGKFYTNRIDFEQEVQIDRITLLHEATNGAGVTRFIVTSRDLEDTESTIDDRTYTNVATNKTRIATKLATDIAQFALSLTNDIIDFKSIRIRYDSIE